MTAVPIATPSRGSVLDGAAALEVVQRHMDAEDRHDAEASVATFTDDCYYFVAPLRARLEGKAAILGWYRDLFSAIPDLSTSNDRFYRSEAGDGSLVVWHQATMEGTHLGTLQGWAATGRLFAVPMLVRIPIAPDGLMKAEEVYFDTTDMFMQLGIVPRHGGRVQRAVQRLHRLQMAISRR